MKSLKIKKLFHNAKQLLGLLALTTILSGCASTAAKIVKVDNFCEGRYTSQSLSKKDYDNIDQIRQNKEWKETIDLILDNKTLNEKEYEYCKTESN